MTGLRARLFVALPLVAALALTAAYRPAAAATSPAATAVPVSNQLTHAGRWIVDPAGRVVFLHGVNVPSKTLPATPQGLNFGANDATLLARLGFNAVRLTLERYAAEPTPGRIDRAYVAKFASVAGLLAQHGIYTLIDFHQDDYGPVFGDNGFPNWMTVTDGLPNLSFSPYPTQEFDNPALNRAFDHLWANDRGSDGKPLQDDDAALLATVASRLRNSPGLLGYEILNEPWPGTAFPQCYNPQTGCPTFDKGEVSAYYQRVATAIRAADPQHLIWYEPLTTFNQGVPTSVVPPRTTNHGFAFHDYSLCHGDELASTGAGNPASQCNAQDVRVLDNALAVTKRTGDPLLETEFGATTSPTAVKRLLSDYDSAMIPWLWWSYTRYVMGINGKGALIPATDKNVNWGLTDALIRPFPKLISGTPLSWHWEASRHVFRFRYTPARASGRGRFPAGATTVVSVPSRLFPRNYQVAVSGGTVTSAPGSPLLSIASCRDATQITVTVAASGAHAPSSCPSR